MNKVVTVGPNKRRINFRHKTPGGLGNIFVVPQGIAETAIPFFIRRRDNAKEYVGIPRVRSALFRLFGVLWIVERHKIHIVFFHTLAAAFSDIVNNHVERLIITGFIPDGMAIQRIALDHGDVLQLSIPFCQCVENWNRRFAEMQADQTV